jgi:hypothetical protein
MARSKGKGRAYIEHPEMHTSGICQGGKRLPHMDPGFQVPHQNEPTPANPISQHKQFKGHSTAQSHGKMQK